MESRSRDIMMRCILVCLFDIFFILFIIIPVG